MPHVFNRAASQFFRWKISALIKDVVETYLWGKIFWSPLLTQISSMQGFEFMPGLTNVLGEIGIFTTVTLALYFLMSVLDVEDSHDTSIPLINLSFCFTGFVLFPLFFVHPPVLLKVNSLSWFWIISFAVVWAFGSASSWGESRLLTYVLSYYALLGSQYSTDTRAFWIKFLSEPQSKAVMVIGLLAGLLLLFGSICGSKLLESHSQVYAFCLLLLSAFLGLGLGGLLHFTTQILSISFA